MSTGISKTTERERLKQARPLPQAVSGQAVHGAWYDARALTDAAEAHGILVRLPNLGYTAVLLAAAQLKDLARAVPPSLDLVVEDFNGAEIDRTVIAASSSHAALTAARELGLQTCLLARVDDAASLHGSIEHGARHDYLVVGFKDPTNIPLELVIASLQSGRTVLIKQINDPADIDDAIVSLGVMEVGADGVMFSPRRQDLLDRFGAHLAAAAPSVALETATVVRAVPVGMGLRSCIDLATLFTPEEGMLIGSTSQGGILCCPEVFHLPYMDLRPFRVNAGAVHSYVFNLEGRTNYLTELGAGSPAMIVGLDGKARKATVGRMKTEMRPLRLIEAAFADDSRVNILLQDDWHVRVYSEDGKPFNITELVAGSKILGHKAEPGRHVGIAIKERILEN
jgi:3-dehydroquinate synthase II/3-amino-4-hydroxybenzoic acid synthase